MTPKKWSANLVIAVLVGGTFNGLMALIIAPLIGLGLAIAITPSLLVASYANTIVAAIAYRIVSKAGMV